MGTVIIVAWLLAIVGVVFALVRRFDPEARGPRPRDPDSKNRGTP